MTNLLKCLDLAERLSVSEAMIYKMVRLRRMPPPVKVGGSTRWRESDITEWIKAGCPATKPAAGPE